MAFQRECEAEADFALVYIEEAHPTDGWTISAVKDAIKQPMKMEERLVGARRLEEHLGVLEASPAITLCVDHMDNAASLAFGALPERLVILKGGVVRFIGGRGPEAYSIEECRTALQALI